MRLHTLLAVLAATSAIALSAVVHARSAPPATDGAAHAPPALPFEALQGSYDLADGRSLRVTTTRGRLHADIGGNGKTEMLPVAENVYASRDKQTTLAFDAQAAEVRLTTGAAR